MAKDTLLSLLLALLNFGGTYLIGHNLFGKAIDSVTWEIIAGAVITLGSTIWGIVDKSAGIEQIESAFRSIFQALGGILVSAGIIKGDTLNTILGLIPIIISAIQSQTSKMKVSQILKGEVAPEVKLGSATGQVAPKVPPVPDPVVVQKPTKPAA